MLLRLSVLLEARIFYLTLLNVKLILQISGDLSFFQLYLYKIGKRTCDGFFFIISIMRAIYNVLLIVS